MEREPTVAVLPPGTRLREELIVRETVGRGGMGIVYAVWHERLNLIYAVKEYLPNELAIRTAGLEVRALPGKEDEFEHLRGKFLAEGQMLAKLAEENPHPNLIVVNDAFDAHGTAYLRMRFERAHPLSKVIEERGLLDERRVLEHWLLPLLDGLEHAHRNNILHRDIKPSNILIRDNDTPLLIDFGAARWEHPGRQATLIKQYTPAFAAPEQLRHDREDPRTDIYSMAATWFYVITGRKPAGYRPGEEWWASSEGRYSREFLCALTAGMEADPERRPRDVAEWRRMLVEAHAASQPVVTPVAATHLADSGATWVSPGTPSAAPAMHAAAPSVPGAGGAAATVIATQPPFMPPSSSARPAWLGKLTLVGLVGAVSAGAAWLWWSSRHGLEPAMPLAPSVLIPASPSVMPTLPTVPPASIPTPTVVAPPPAPEAIAAPVPPRAAPAGAPVTPSTPAPVSAPPAATAAVSAPLATPPPLCSELAAVLCAVRTRIAALAAEVEEHEYSLKLSSSASRAGYHEGERAVFYAVNQSDAAGFLYVDWFDLEGNVLHLLPTLTTPDNLVVAGAQRVIGARDETTCRQQPDDCFIVAPPHGTNLIVATWSAAPLFSGPRRSQVEVAADYLNALERAVRPGSSGKRRRVSFTVIPLLTHP